MDVIVPIHDAFRHVYRCLCSVRRHTDLMRHRLVLVDDASRGPEMAPYLERFAAAARVGAARVVLLRNPTNRGFVHSANRGIRASRGDVVLLNSDTVVTGGWLDRMIAAAYSRPSVASVTPFSNDATICSIPRFCAANELPPGHTVDSFAALVQRCSPRLRPELPTAVGFCMYLTRHALARVGPFDERLFGRGYGEENDWCMRAAARGMRHLLEDSTFVYHHGGASFTREARDRLAPAMLALVAARWPHYLPTIERFMAENPLAAHHQLLERGLAEGVLGSSA